MPSIISCLACQAIGPFKSVAIGDIKKKQRMRKRSSVYPKLFSNIFLSLAITCAMKLNQKEEKDEEKTLSNDELNQLLLNFQKKNVHQNNEIPKSIAPRLIELWCEKKVSKLPTDFALPKCVAHSTNDVIASISSTNQR